jgi:hypothetical protein
LLCSIQRCTQQASNVDVPVLHRQLQRGQAATALCGVVPRLQQQPGCMPVALADGVEERGQAAVVGGAAVAL